MCIRDRLRVAEREQGFTIEFWGEPPEIYELSIQSPTGEILEVSSSIGSRTQELSFVFVETNVYVNYIPVSYTHLIGAAEKSGKSSSRRCKR